jgi:hypothetical protein
MQKSISKNKARYKKYMFTTFAGEKNHDFVMESKKDVLSGLFSPLIKTYYR